MQTVIGGWTKGGYPGDFVESTLADHSLKPIITEVKSWNREISPHALAFDHSTGKLYYSDVLSGSIERIGVEASDDDGTGGTAVMEWDTFLPSVGETLSRNSGGRAGVGRKGYRGGVQGCRIRDVNFCPRLIKLRFLRFKYSSLAGDTGK